MSWATRRFLRKTKNRHGIDRKGVILDNSRRTTTLLLWACKMRLKFALPVTRLRHAAGALALLVGTILTALASRVTSLRSEVGMAGVDTDNVIESFQIERDGDCILLPVTVENETYQFLADTGSTFSCVDEGLLRHLSPTGQEMRLNGCSDKPLFSIRDAFVGESRLPIPGPVICHDLSAIRRVSGHDIRGILGMSFLRSHIIDIDFDAGRLRILKSASKASGLVVPMGTKFDCPTIDVQAGPANAAPFVIDTGCVGPHIACIETARFDEMLERGHLNLNGPGLLSVTFHGVESRREARIGSVKLAEFIHYGMPISDSGTNRVGLGYMSRFRVVFDFPSARAFFEAGRRYDDEAGPDISGLSLERVNGETRVYAARAGRPAARAGIVAGNCITAVDKRPIQALSMHQLHRIFSTEDRDVSVTVRRREQFLRLEVHLPPLLEPVID